MKRFYQQLNVICKNPCFLLLFIPIAVGFLLLYSYTTSPFFIHDGMDSAVFKTMGLAWLRGYVPYQDIFDHKGPLLYLFNAFGQWLIPGRAGIFMLQCIFLTFTLILWFRTAQLFTTPFLSFFVTMCTLLMYGGVIQEGNQCEEWMLPFFSCTLYLLLKYFVRQREQKAHPWYYGLVYGLCFGATFMIRPNDAVAYMGGAMIGLTFYMLYRKEYLNWIYNVLAFLGGMCCVVLPFVIYFASKQALGDFAYGLLGFNEEYSGGMSHLVKSVCKKEKRVLLLLFLSLWTLAYNSPHKVILLGIFPIAVLETMLMGTSLFLHYYIVIMPLLLVMLATLCMQRNLSIVVLTLGILFLVPIASGTLFPKNGVKSFKRQVKHVVHQTNPLHCVNEKKEDKLSMFYDEAGKVLANIPMDERTQIWNCNLRWDNDGPCFSIFWHFQLVPCNKITYAKSSRLIAEDDFDSKRPKWCLCKMNTQSSATWYQPIDSVTDSILSVDYQCVAMGDSCVCPIALYRRIDKE